MAAVTEFLSVTGRRVAPCTVCGRWTGASLGSCCVPCCNNSLSAGTGTAFPHQALCDRAEALKVNYPRDLVDTSKACPRCGAVGVWTNDDRWLGKSERRCPDPQCGWSAR